MNRPNINVDREAEADLLGALLLGGKENWRAARATGIAAGVFADLRHRTIFGAMEGADSTDLVAVDVELRRRGVADEAGGRPFLAELMERVPSPASTLPAAEAVMDAYRRRSVAEAANRVEAAARGGSTAEIAAAMSALADIPATAGWSEPRLFPEGEPPPVFPLDVLPYWLVDWAVAQAKAKSLAVDVPALLGLGVVATAAMKKFVVAPNDGFREPVNLYLVISLPSGEGKSPAFKAAFAPVTAYEGRRRAQEAPEIARVERDRALFTKRVEELQRRFARGKTNELEKIRADLEGTQEALAALPPPRAAFRLTGDDVTPEALEDLLAAHGERITVASTEGGPFGVMDGRYSEKGGPNFDLYLKAYSGDPHLCDRIGRKGGKLENPCVNLILTVQPVVVAEILGNAAFSGRGLLGRCFIVPPESRVGFRDVRRADAVDTSAADACYAAHVARLLESYPPEGVPNDGATLTLTPEAREVWTCFREATERRLRPDADLEDLRDFGNKLGGSTLRLAGLLHFMDFLDVGEASAAPIPAATMRRAVKFAEYFAAHQLRTFVGAGEVERFEAGRAALGWIRKRKIAEITPRDLQRGTGKRGRRFGKVEACVEALETLESLGWLRRNPSGDAFMVHPSAHGAKTPETSDKSDRDERQPGRPSEKSDAPSASSADISTRAPRPSETSDAPGTSASGFRSIAEEAS